MSSKIHEQTAEERICKAIGTRIKHARERAEITAKQLAKLLEMSNSAIYMWERGERFPTVGALYEMGKLFRVRVHDLLPETLVVSRLKRLSDVIDTLSHDSHVRVRDFISRERKEKFGRRDHVIEVVEMHESGAMSFTRRTVKKAQKVQEVQEVIEPNKRKRA